MADDTASTSSLPDSGSAPPPRSGSVSRIIRRVHLFLGLFLTPWLLMYALSTVVMNHRPLFAKLYPTPNPAYTIERELEFRRTFPAGTAPADIGSQILDDIGLPGSHRVTGGKDGGPLVIERYGAVVQRRITWTPETAKLVIEKQEFRGANFLDRMHRRRGYQQPYQRDDLWAVSVDLAVLTIIFWSLSGIWLWWELKVTRVIGAVCGAIGLVVFAFLLMRI